MQAVLTFWFSELTKDDWFKQSDELDEQITQRFKETHRQAMAGELYRWRDTPDGRLAEVLVLDQFSRNMFRNQAAAFKSDPLALALAQEAVRVGDDKKLSAEQRPFIYMPYMHSESAVIHEVAIDLFTDTANLSFEQRHKAIIDQFNRYPHRNAALGRRSTKEEIEWMKNNSGF